MSIGWEDLELQLRALPGVVAAGFSVDGERVAVQLLLEAEADESELRQLVADLTIPVADRPVSVEIAHLAEPGGQPLTSDRQRVRLAGVWTEAITGTLKVELARGSRIGDGSSNSVGALASAEATLAALSDLGIEATFVAETAAGALDEVDAHVIEVALQDEQGERRYGIARANSVNVAAARATLHALNRFLTESSSQGRPASRPPFFRGSAHLPTPSAAGTPTNRKAVEPGEPQARSITDFRRWYERFRPEASKWWTAFKTASRPASGQAG